MYMTMVNPTFAERTAALKKVAVNLAECAEIVLAEVQRMESAQIRFAERTGKRASRAQKDKR